MERWVVDISTALSNLGGIAHRSDILAEVKRVRPKPHPDSIVQTIQRTIQNYSSDASGVCIEDLFYTVHGIGSGVWGLRSMLTGTMHAKDIIDANPASRILTETYRILRDTELARKIKLLHGNKCQICQMTILLPEGMTYSEAHHIQHLAHPHDGPDIAGNIMVLCPNHHVMMDLGAMKLNAADIRSVQGHKISAEYIEYHNTVICTR